MRSAELYRCLEEISEDGFVLHGSPHLLTQIEPRQTSYRRLKAFSRYGVYATTYVEVALLYALIHDSRDRWSWALDETGPSPKIIVRAEEGCKYGPGYLYVTSRKYFRQIKDGKGLIYLTRKPVQVVKVLEVDGFILQELIDRGLLEIVLRDTPES